MAKPKIAIGFLGNIKFDSRSSNLFYSLTNNGFKTSFIGFDWLTKNFSTLHTDNLYVKKLKKNFSLIFYLKFAVIFFYKLVTSDAKIFFAEDILTLPFVVSAAKIKKAKIVYDSRELYGYLAGLKDKKFIQYILRSIEKFFISKADLVLVTGKMDQEFLIQSFKINNIYVLRNLPLTYPDIEKIDLHRLLNVDKRFKVILYQGVVLHGRGLKILIEVIPNLKDYILVIIGDGEQMAYYKEMVSNHSLQKKVFFIGKVSNEELFRYTSSAYVGTALIENISLSYYYALPNKLFEYIMCGLPVLVSKLPQMEEIVAAYEVGITVDVSNSQNLIQAIIELEKPEVYNTLVKNCKIASKDLNWEKEVLRLIKILNQWSEYSR